MGSAGAGRWTRAETERYWTSHEELRADVDWAADPDALDNVCNAGAPGWLNAYYAAGQRGVFEALVSRCGPGSYRRALDVGCGAGRWSRLLRDGGYAVTGIDLQAGLIERARTSDPDIHYEVAGIQEFEASKPFDVVTSVTVLQHIPWAEQEDAVQAIRRSLRPGGRAIVLECLGDFAPHVFPRSIGGWIELFGLCGFEVVECRPYDFNPALRAVTAMRRYVQQALSGSDVPAGWESPTQRRIAPTDEPARRRALRRVGNALERGAVAIDRRLDPRLSRRGSPPAPRHAGFVFEMV